MSLQELNQPWAISLSDSRKVVQGIAAIRQRIWIALGTAKGSDPMRPFFGTLIYKMVDMPAPEASANIKKEIIDAIALWVPEIELKTIKDVFFTPQSSGTNNYGIRFEVSYLINDLTDVVSFSLENGSISWEGMQSIILSDTIIQTGNRINIILIINSVSATPARPNEGFATGLELYSWVTTNWSQFGTWSIFEDTILLYGNASIKNGNLDVYAMAGGDFTEDFNDDFNTGS